MYSDIEKKERRKIITITVITAVLILSLIVAIVIVATNKKSTNIGGDNNWSFALEEDEAKTEEKTDKETAAETKTNEKSESNIGNISMNSTSAASKTEVTEEVKQESSLPTTGPENMLSTALVLGALTTSATAYIMSRKRA